MEDTIIRTVDEYNMDFKTLMTICGENDEGLKYLQQRYGVKINILNGTMRVDGKDEKTEQIVEQIIQEVARKITNDSGYSTKDLRFVCDAVEDGGDAEKLNFTIAINSRGKHIRPKTAGQARYVKAITKNSVTFGVGPAGTGKTYLAVALAVRALKNKEVERIILTRPAVEAGEKLGFLPGDLGAKVDPYLRPLFDALQEMMGLESYNRAMEKGAIEIAPLAYMRGRTLSNAFIILDEAQNTTKEQMKMFLTRMGEGSKIVVTGDITQIDLPRHITSGLVEAAKVLIAVNGISVINLSGKDVVRHEMVMRIVNAYEEYERGAVDGKEED